VDQSPCVLTKILVDGGNSQETSRVKALVGYVDGQNIKRMYEAGHGHVHVLAASIRNVRHLLGAFALDAELATAPGKIWEEWAAASFPLPAEDLAYKGRGPGQKSRRPALR
jgi:hypothetical protein